MPAPHWRVATQVTMSNQLLEPPKIDTDNLNELDSPPLLRHIVEVEDSFWTSLSSNVRERFSPVRQLDLQLKSKPIPVNDPFHVEPIWVDIFEDFRDVFFPRKLPPLQLESHAIAVPDPMARPRDRKSSLISIGLHLAAFIAIAIFLFWHPKKKEMVAQVVLPPVFNITPFMPFAPSPTTSGGGGGGGDRSLLQAAMGKLPKIAKTQFVPPDEIIRNPKPKLEVEPTVVMPDNIKLPNNNMPNLGDPSTVVKGPASNGTGSAGGIGSGKSGGIGSGNGAGVGPGEGGGYGGGVYKVGGGVSPPRLIYAPEAEFSDQARMAKYQGDVPVEIIVDAKGLPHDPRVIRPLGMGLDEKALEAVKQYRFKPSMLNGRPVAVRVTMIVEFHIY
ncbi:MAG TPA: energy transducer TonB [Acidobacteriaceae bacterium]|nr:energy transducer TonB [Acidobacteriaceae bacterium]